MLKHPRRSPLKVTFLLTSMPVGGAETLLANLVRRIDRSRFAPEIVCLKQRGPLGDELASELPVHSELLAHKLDVRVLLRLCRLFRSRRTDAVVTVGAGDKMFWGRLAAKLAGVPVVASALHSTGWPDSVGRLNRLLTPLTDAFIAVAQTHAEFLVQRLRFPHNKVVAIANGIDVERFAPRDARPTRDALGIEHDAPVMGIVAALRPEKNHALFLTGARRILDQLPRARFLVVGDGDRRAALEQLASQLRIAHATRFVGSRSDIPELLAAIDVLALTSHNEASPVSILEAMAAERPVVAANVGSVAELVVDGETGRLFPAGNVGALVEAAIPLLTDGPRRRRMGQAARRKVLRQGSLDSMVQGYQQLLERLYAAKRQPRASVGRSAARSRKLTQATQ